MIKVCEHEIYYCPYCGTASFALKEQPKLEPVLQTGRVHAIYCEVCSGLFFVPCED